MKRPQPGKLNGTCLASASPPGTRSEILPDHLFCPGAGEPCSAESGANRRVRVGNCTGRALHFHSPKYLDFSSSPAHGYGFPNRSPRAGCWFTDLNSSSLRLAFGRPNSHRPACTRRPMAEPHQMSQGKDTDAQLQKLFRVCIALGFSLLPLYPTPALRTAAPFRRHLAAGLTP